MPRAISGPGFQAVILCGPGVSLNTFTSKMPKALVPIANRPMVWYPLDWCYRMGISDITLITPPESAPALEAALSQNPHLTSLPAPKPEVLSPPLLTPTTGTGELFRLPEVQSAITGDFIVLPCDLVCELEGTALLEAWMIQTAGLGGATGGLTETNKPAPMTLGGEKSGRRGGMAVWYHTKGEGSVKGEETDFVATTPLPPPIVPSPRGSIRPQVSNLVYSLPTDTLNDVTAEKKGFPIRQALIRRHGRVRMRTTHRDAHIYVFPHWVLRLMKRNALDSVSEDVVGLWAKATWQHPRLAEKLGMREIFADAADKEPDDAMGGSGILDDEVDVAALSSTYEPRTENKVGSFSVPPMLAYVQPPGPSLPLIRRVDTAALLLSVSLRLARLPSLEEGSSSPLSHTAKTANPSGVPKKCRVESADSLLAENVTVAEKCNIKESVIGANCEIGEGARLLRCLLMDGAVVGSNCQLTGCILGRRCKVEGGPARDEKTVLKDCEVQEGNIVPWGTEAKNEKFMIFEGLSDEGDVEEDMAEHFDDVLADSGEPGVSQR
ncbi:nucleotide-diphospho-sugar transferase [Lineolata rhizophorae]|uniref:Mannose-1-phosphate guanyltransferase n=1 Tax=Lineolata rhizophorae TaxID=578093 RepID=A0A6A6PDS4_9PEZI|nr:nucleotide-diphospho-sugar transferase [Lineolata rhizophorae]